LPTFLPSEHIDALLVKFLLGEANEAEVREASDWIASNSENEVYFQQLIAVWKSGAPQVNTKHLDASEAWSRFQLKTKQKSSRFTGFRIAAAVMIICCTVALAYLFFRPAPKTQQLMVVATAGTKTQQLPDNSEVVLNKNSSLEYPAAFHKKQRLVTLKGEGFFKIQPNASQPFLIRVSDMLVKVVGTSFNIKELSGRVEIVVETGIVSVSRKGKTVELHPGEKIISRYSDSSLNMQKETDQLYNYYRTKIFICDNTPLYKLVAVLNEAYGVQIDIGRPALNSLLLTTTFENEPIDKILQIITQTLGLKAEKKGDKIILQ
jgi:transmembrane sensor